MPQSATRAASDRKALDSGVTEKAAIMALRAQLDGLRRENAILQQEYRKLRDGMARATSEHQRLLLNAEAARRQAEEGLRTREQLQVALVQARQNVTLAERARSAALQEADSLRESASSDRATLDKCRQAYKEIRRLEDSLREEIAQLKSELAAVNASLDPRRAQALSALLSTLRGGGTK